MSLRFKGSDLRPVLAEADFVCIVVPLSDATRKLIGARELKLMKPSAFLINIARGPVVDEAALVEALQNGTIRGAGLDVQLSCMEAVSPSQLQGAAPSRLQPSGGRIPEASTGR